MDALVQIQGFDHLTRNIFAFLDIPSLNNCRLVCTSWVDFIDNDRKLWVELLKQLKINRRTLEENPNLGEVFNYFLKKETAVNLKKMFTFLVQYLKKCTLPMLLYAIEKEDLEILCILENSPLDFHVTYGGATALHYACMTSLTMFLKMYSISFEKELDINARDNSGRTLLHWASHFNQPRIIQMLLDVSEDMWVHLRTVDNGMNIPLHYACESGHIKVVKYLCKAMARYGIDTNVWNQNGYNPLHKACRKGHLEVVKCIVQHADQLDIDLNATTLYSYGWTPLHLASIHGHTDVVSYLLDVSLEKNIAINRACDWNFNVTPFLAACIKGKNAKTVELYLQRAKECNINIAANGLLHLAVAFGKPEIVKIFLEHYIKQQLDLNYKVNGLTAFQCAMAAPRSTKVIQEFLSLKIPINAKRQVLNPKDKESRTPFQRVCRELDFEMVKLLLLYSEDGIDVMATDDFGCTPINDPRLAPIFFDWYTKRGLSRTNERGETPFLECCRRGSLAIVKMFAEHPETDLMATDIDGRTALHMAMMNNYIIYLYINELFQVQENELLHRACLNGATEIAFDILCHAGLNGINVNARDAYGRTPFQCAELNRHYETMEMIYCMSYDMDLDVRPSSWIQHLKHYFQMQFLGNDYS